MVNLLLWVVVITGGCSFVHAGVPMLELSHPPKVNGNPALVNISITIFNIFDIDEGKGSLSLELNLKMYWKDPSVENWTRHHPFTDLEEGRGYVIVNPTVVSDFWLPHVYIEHMRGAMQSTLISKAASLRVYADGYLRYISRLEVAMACPMDFHYYPADTQTCRLDMKSFVYPSYDVMLAWNQEKGPGATLAFPIPLHSFDIMSLETSSDFLKATTNYYSRLTLAISLRRKLGYYLVHVYVPSGVITIVSWLSFVVPPDFKHHSGRTAICITTLLALTAMLSHVTSNSPSVSYMKILNLWMIACMSFVFVVLVEYVIVLRLQSVEEERGKKRAKMLESQKEREDTHSISSLCSCCHSSDFVLLDMTGSSSRRERGVSISTESKTPLEQGSHRGSFLDPVPPPVVTASYPTSVVKLEKYTPIVVPLSFLTFNILYWPVVFIGSKYFAHTNDMNSYFYYNHGY